MFVRWPVGVVLAVALLLLAGRFSAPASAQASSVSDDIVFQKEISGPASAFPKIFPSRVVESWNSYVRNGVIKSFHNHGADIEPSAVIASSALVSLGSRQVLKSKVEIRSKLFFYQYAGVVGENVVIVLCSSRTARPFEARGSACEQQAAKVFGP